MATKEWNGRYATRGYKPAVPRLAPRDGYFAELYTTPLGLYVCRQNASHGCLVTWADMRRALKRYATVQRKAGAR